MGDALVSRHELPPYEHYVLYPGYDELSVEQRVTPIRSLRLPDMRAMAEDELRRVGLSWERAPMPPDRRGLKYSVEGLDLHLDPIGRGRWSVWADLDRQALHRRYAGVRLDGESVVAGVAAVLGGRDGPAVRRPCSNRALTLHVDATPLLPIEDLYPLLHNRTRVPIKNRAPIGHPWSVSGDGLLAWYDKSAEILVHPEKAWIEDDWIACGWRPEMGPMGRWEVSGHRPRLRTWRVSTAREFWRRSLDALSLRVPPEGSRDPRKERWNEHPLWGLMRPLFDDDTANRIYVEASIPRESTVQIRRDENEALRAAGRVAARRGDDLEAVVRDTGVIGAILRRRPEAESILRHAHARAIATMAPRLVEPAPPSALPEGKNRRQEGDLPSGGSEDDSRHN